MFIVVHVTATDRPSSYHLFTLQFFELHCFNPQPAFPGAIAAEWLNAGLQEIVNAETAEPSACPPAPPIPPREPQDAEPLSEVEQRRPQVPWVTKTAERLEKPIADLRQKYAP